MDSFAVRMLTVLLAVTAGSYVPLHAQFDDDPPISVGDSSVGYIDSATPGDQVRLRFDFGYGVNRANRAEFFWAWSPPTGPGPAQTESNVDYQSITAYVEKLIAPRVSAFIEAPTVMANPVINDNATGFGDIQTGVKWALQQDHDSVTTLQLRVYVPTGDVGRGTGVGHVSIEPGLLFHRRLQYCLNLEGELRYWAPIGGTSSRAGPIVRYGTGLSRKFGCDCRHITPVLEVVGWTVLDGSTLYSNDAMVPIIESVDGDTIVNAKAGLRLGWNPRNELYVGYGRSLTGDHWYSDILRAEWRWKF